MVSPEFTTSLRHGHFLSINNILTRTQEMSNSD